MATTPTTTASATESDLALAEKILAIALSGVQQFLGGVKTASGDSSASGASTGSTAGASTSIGLNAALDFAPAVTAGLNLAGAVVKLSTQLDSEMNTPAMLTAAEKQAVQDHLDSMSKALQGGDENSVRLMLAALQTK